ncbi:MAG: CPBP family intramembrane metalloprotease [Akkermansiaceae bacterium]|nr:CPBP family intramembrane metalloprotease [Akkermansiaceae bacterium]NNM31055.1 CPBP family intramembrane metalloprotease [Akkermansiaceae bacterium]
MKALFTSDVTKLIVYVVCCFALAAVLTPWLYNAGMFLAEFTDAGTANPALDWLGEKARRADFATFFKRALLLSALLLLAPLILSLRVSRKPASLQQSPWSVYLPEHSIAHHDGQPLRNPRSGWLQALTGFILAAGLLFAMGYFLVLLGWFYWEQPFDWKMGLRKSVPPAIFASLLEEIIFRGALLGIFLRTFRPGMAIVLLSLLFAALHFLQPPDDLVVANPEGNLAGFELLVLIAQRFTLPLPLLYEFASLTAVGLILGYARYATASLWLPIGLHAGWVFAFKLFNRLADRDPDLDDRYNLLIGRDLKEGLIPLATLAITALLVFLFVRILRQSPSHPDPGMPVATP